MATVFAAFHRALRPALARHVARPCRSAWHPRAIHSSPIVFKKKHAGAPSESDDLFGESEDDSGDLFGEDSSSSNPAAAQAQAPPLRPTDLPPKNPSVPAPAQYDPVARFEDLYQFLHAYLVEKNAHKVPRVSIWQHLFNSAPTPEHLERAIDLLPKWRDTKRSLSPQNKIDFQLARRVQKLRCPLLALKVFGDRPKYGLDLSLPAAHIILHSLLFTAQPQDVLTFSSLFSVYGLPPVSSDLLSTAFLMRACFKHASDESLTVARSLVPSLQTLLADPASMSFNTSRNRWDSKRERVWLAYTLGNIQRDLETHGIEHAWLDEWMTASGNAARISSQ
ncbi:hypothetical protein L226DRAFT_571833 [Lentinus tigrinus ALCF2SS1-7]|uniref:Uncharacterized protein n=1 Tax=Lentinus tigrinus ALCF2SS1-6 TaxID=1328759 RepID=A0A5C2RYU3_9APHY|nr:hypothetical protein L227DRAFT_508930 [Lentinus tigrinus ALCF2SS1-6]RPD73930.1 hypothetical protein L226DRAFT_571833 [Lentinus tigrinus ALCF2SS1-7]